MAHAFSSAFSGAFDTAQQVAGHGAWEQLISIYREAAADLRAERNADPEACPNDGEPLSTGPDRELFCKFDGWRPGGRYVGC